MLFSRQIQIVKKKTKTKTEKVIFLCHHTCSRQLPIIHGVEMRSLLETILAEPFQFFSCQRPHIIIDGEILDLIRAWTPNRIVAVSIQFCNFFIIDKIQPKKSFEFSLAEVIPKTFAFVSHASERCSFDKYHAHYICFFFFIIDFWKISRNRTNATKYSICEQHSNEYGVGRFRLEIAVGCGADCASNR